MTNELKLSVEAPLAGKDLERLCSGWRSRRHGLRCLNDDMCHFKAVDVTGTGVDIQIKV